MATYLGVGNVWTRAVRKYVANPRRAIALTRCLVPFRALLHDPETYHAVAGWSSGRAPHRNLTELFPGVAAQHVTLHRVYDRVVGWSVDVPELTAMLCVIRMLDAKRVLEIGTFDGFTALNFAANMPEGGIVTTIDLPPERRASIRNASPHERIGEKYRDTPFEHRIQQVYADSTTLDWDTLDGPFDFAFIDGCHDYPFVAADTQHVLQQLAPDGVVAWHDYGAFPSVSRAVDDAVDASALDAAVVYGTRLAIGRLPSGSPNQCRPVDFSAPIDR